jgi:hypothetical protein
MPLYGTLAGTARESIASSMPDLDTETLVLEKVTTLQTMFEIDSKPMLDVLPKALHPTIPPTVTFVFWAVPDSPAGAFTAAQLRVGCRAGARPRGWPIAVFVDNPSAGRLLEERWGYRCREASVRVNRAHHLVEGSVTADGARIVDVGLIDPEAISGGDIQYTASMNLAHVGGELLLVQVDPEYTFHRADRGRPELRAFDTTACGEPRLQIVYPISASVTVSDITMPVIRYTCDPDVPATQGTRKVR